MIGKIVSHYRITSKLGEGGMGEVFQAQDISLGRKVALKFIPDKFADDAERLARFKREARLLASLGHPNIAIIHGLEQSDNRNFIVLELVEGETLAQRIARGPLPIKEALDVCRQLAEGLESAHEKGIIHRDLKPSNIKFTSEGKVKILDFGLARAVQEQKPIFAHPDSVTIPDNVTCPGMIIGTASYMSPEQAKGKVIDKRMDIWAFGCVLYECLSGKRAFPGETVTEIVASVLKSEPDISVLPADTPASIRKLLLRCLQKEPNLRLRDIGDARIELSESASQAPYVESVPRRISFLRLMFGAAALIVISILVSLFITGGLRKPVPPSALRSIIPVEEGHWLAAVMYNERPTRNAIDVSSDGGFLVYSAIAGASGLQAKSKIYLRRMDQMEAAPVEGTDGGVSPFLSPDNQWIAFFDGEKLKKVPTSGGVPSILCDTDLVWGADWGQDGTIIFSQGEPACLFRIPADGGLPDKLTVPDPYTGHGLPHYLPNNTHILFTITGNRSRLGVLNVKTREWRELLRDAADGRYIPSGHLVFLRQGVLMAVPFDPHTLQLRGQPAPVLEGIMQALNAGNSQANTGAGQYSISDSGMLAYIHGGIFPESDNSLVHVNQEGNLRIIADFKSRFWAPRLSPDGRWIAYEAEEKLWLYDLMRGSTTVLTGEDSPTVAEWTPDGKQLVFGLNRSDIFDLFSMPVDGSSPMVQLTNSMTHTGKSPGSFNHDGSILAYLEYSTETGYDIVLLDMKSRRTTPFLNSKAWEGWPRFSPDGRWMAYASNETGTWEVWIRPFPVPVGRLQISQKGSSREGAMQPLWSRDGRHLYYRQSNAVWAVDIRTNGGFSAGKPYRLFDMPGFAGGIPWRNWDLWPDGNGFLMVKLDERKPQPATEIILVQNWFEELRRMVPGK
ncbi:MAG: protein kinase [Acidobacteriota bacterium]|nr:protein kinase [Acidobacteriota bacterium]